MDFERADDAIILLTRLLRVIDEHSDRLNQEWNELGAPEGTSYEDHAEYATGLGFVACQAFLVAVCAEAGVPKQEGLLCGPRLNEELTLAEAINHAANFWKHQAEWRWVNPTRQQDRTASGIGASGFVPIDYEYPLSGILAELASPAMASFEPVVTKLRDWRSAVAARDR